MNGPDPTVQATSHFDVVPNPSVQHGNLLLFRGTIPRAASKFPFSASRNGTTRSLFLPCLVCIAVMNPPASLRDEWPATAHNLRETHMTIKTLFAAALISIVAGGAVQAGTLTNGTFINGQFINGTSI